MRAKNPECRSNIADRIVEDPEIMAGKPTVRGTRIPVGLVLKRLSQDLDMETLFESYPRLTEHDVKACLAKSGWTVFSKSSGTSSTDSS